MSFQKVTVSLPPDLLRDVDRRGPNRSKFVQEAVRHELRRRDEEDLRQSLQHPHPESLELAELGLGEWRARISDDDVAGLLDPDGGTDVQWIPGIGWRESSG